MESTLLEEKSTHKVPVIEVKLLEHTDADLLSIVKVDDFTCVVRTSDWKDGDLAAWIPPDSLVDISRKEFSFLKKSLIRAARLRGVVSYGLLVPAPENLKIGDNAAEILGVKHYNPEEDVVCSGKGKKDSLFVDQLHASPKGNYVTYDVDAFLKYGSKVFVENELVVVTEKIHGENARFVFSDGEFFAGSRNTWKREFPVCKYTEEQLLEKVGDPGKVLKILQGSRSKNKWWKVYDTYPGLKLFCEENPKYCVYGELYGDVKEMKYGCKPGEQRFAAFDILSPEGKFLDYGEFIKICQKYSIPRVPLLLAIPYSKESVEALVSGKSVLPNADHIREGIVIKPIEERWNERLGRVCLKLVSVEYYEKKYHAF